MNPSRANNWIGKSNALINFSTYEETLRCCHEALKLEPDEWRVHTAQVHEFFKNYKEVSESIEKALIHDSNNKLAHQVKLAISSGLKYGRYFYTPISRSTLLSIIPLENEIIYSSKAELSQVIGFYPVGKKRKKMKTILA